MANKFDSKSFNQEAFSYMVGRVPNLKVNQLKKCGALAANPDIRAVFQNQDGASYAKMAMRGTIDGTAVNYDGETDITSTTTKSYEQGVTVVGRAKAWIERDFSYDITGGVDFMENVAAQVAEYKDGLDQDTLLSVLKGIFSMTGTNNLNFVNNHTSDITTEDDGVMTAISLNKATNKACGANKKKFAMVVMHSDVATNLENLQLIEHLKYTDPQGFTRELDMGTWNGKLVLVDDDMPTTEVAASGSGSTAVEAHTVYTSYVLGEGAIAYEDIGAKVPFEIDRDAKSNGGEDTLYMRQRKVFAPFGISYEKVSQASLSPTDIELATGSNWALVNTGETTETDRTYIDHKAIPICRILSKG
ncbi:MAG: phage coat protein [Clostridia bacterium]